MNDDALLIAQLEDKAVQAADRYMITSGSFLDSHQRRIAEDLARSGRFPVRVFFYGGYMDAERCLPVFLPDYATEEDAKELLSVIRVTVPRQKGGGGQSGRHGYYGCRICGFRSFRYCGQNKGVSGIDQIAGRQHYE